MFFTYFSGYIIAMWLSLFSSADTDQSLFRKISSLVANYKCMCQFFNGDNLGFARKQFLKDKYENYPQFSRNATRKPILLFS